MSGGADGLFVLEVEPEELQAAADRLTSLREDLEGERAGVAAAPSQWAAGWRGGAATAVGAEVSALAGHMAAFPGLLDAAATTLTTLATSYREALATVATLRTRHSAAAADCSAALSASRARYTRDLGAIPAGVGQQTGMYREEASAAARVREADAVTTRTAEQATATAEYDQLMAELRTATREAGAALAAAVVVPVPGSTVSTYLATGVLDLGPVPPTELADLSLAQQHQVQEDLARVSLDVQHDIAAGELDEDALDELDALLVFSGGRVLLADAARDAREGVAGAMADVARRAADQTTPPDRSADDLLLLGDLLRRFGRDEDMTTPFLVGLGGAGTLDLTRSADRMNGTDPATNPYLETAAALRVALMTSSHDTSFPAHAFATDLVDRAADAMGEMDSGSPGVALAYLLAGPPPEADDAPPPRWGSFFLQAAVERTATREQAFAADHGGGGDGRGLWLQGYAGQFSQLATTFEGYPDRLSSADGAANDYLLANDPLVFAVRHLASDSLAGREVLGGTSGAYLFAERDWGLDGFRAITAAGERAATDAVPGTIAWDRALRVTSAMVNGLGGRDERDLDAFTDASAASVARTLSAHMPSVHASIVAEFQDTSEPLEEGVVLAAFGQDASFTAARLGELNLDRLVRETVAHESGVTAMRIGLNAYQGVLASETVARVTSGEAQPDQFVVDMLDGSGRLEAWFGQRVGDEAVATGRREDEVIGFWIDAASFGVSQGGDALGAVPHPLAKATSVGVSAFGDPAADLVRETWADNAETAAEHAEQTAEATADRVSWAYAQALHEAGVNTLDGMPDAVVLPDGRLRDWGELTLAQQDTARLQMAEDRGDEGIFANPHALSDAMRTSPLPYYHLTEED